MASYPRLLADRDVVVIRDGQPEQTRLRGWLDGHDGPAPSYRIELVIRVGNYTCPYSATAPDMFEALANRGDKRASPVQRVLCLEPARAASRRHDPFRDGARPGSGGAQGMRLVRSGLLADAAVDPLAEQIGVAEVAGILLDHVEYHLAQRNGRAVLHRAADGEVG